MPKYHCQHPGCHKFFMSEDHLEAHVRTHQGLLPFLCPFPGCNKSFSLNGNMKSHYSTHDNTRCFACAFPGCGKQFKRARKLEEHMHIAHHTALRNSPTVASPASEESCEEDRPEVHNQQPQQPQQPPQQVNVASAEMPHMVSTNLEHVRYQVTSLPSAESHNSSTHKFRPRSEEAEPTFVERPLKKTRVGQLPPVHVPSRPQWLSPPSPVQQFPSDISQWLATGKLVQLVNPFEAYESYEDDSL